MFFLNFRVPPNFPNIPCFWIACILVRLRAPGEDIFEVHRSTLWVKTEASWSSGLFKIVAWIWLFIWKRQENQSPSFYTHGSQMHSIPLMLEPEPDRPHRRLCEPDGKIRKRAKTGHSWKSGKRETREKRDIWKNWGYLEISEIHDVWKEKRKEGYSETPTEQSESRPHIRSHVTATSVVIQLRHS